ncbi:MULTISPECIES: histone deacetylase [Trichocoleus]|uniref:Histone deacetylase n=1 Tax=Trichocoleus desertorum GB2-A4 TaxID=2933944 RepID=A0ABV0J7L8_9CYAN|nr:histone deacetylase [Trichocoleus sp. FACHB-46]MBD1863373.1 histone deacetylase [Trichocoleus sp. FACHB-46]
MLAVIYSDEFLEHKTGRFHPERPERLTSIVAALKAAAWADQLQWRSPTPIDQRPIMTDLGRVHPPTYIEQIQQLAQRGGGYLDPDTPVSPRSYDVALLAVSAWLDGVDQVLQTGNPAFVLARPPGHHALSDCGMGFCLFSNAAIAAYYALEQPGINRVAILDWDVHHGNGTQAIVEKHPQIAYCSLHESPNYPGTGLATERGLHNNVLNLPMPMGSTMASYQPLFEEKVLPFLGSFQPDLLIVSAGYDANHADPLSGISLKPEDYGIFTQYCLEVTSKIVFGLEGGYDLPTLSQSVVETIKSCLFRP